MSSLNSNKATHDLTKEDLDQLRQASVIQFGPFMRYYTAREEPTARDIAHHSDYRWRTNIASFQQDGKWYAIWVSWDGCVRIECEGEVILRLWYPAAEIFAAMVARQQATSRESFVTTYAGRYDP